MLTNHLSSLAVSGSCEALADTGQLCRYNDQKTRLSSPRKPQSCTLEINDQAIGIRSKSRSYNQISYPLVIEDSY